MLCSLLLAVATAAKKLPLIEVPATKGASDTLVVFVSGDGGWASIDKSISRLPANLRARTRMIALLGASPKVEFEFHVGDWMRSTSKTGYEVKPEVDKLAPPHHVLCLTGEDDKDSLCRMLSGPSIDVVILKG